MIRFMDTLERLTGVGVNGVKELALFGLGLAGLGFARRRKAA